MQNIATKYKIDSDVINNKKAFTEYCINAGDEFNRDFLENVNTKVGKFAYLEGAKLKATYIKPSKLKNKVLEDYLKFSKKDKTIGINKPGVYCKNGRMSFGSSRRLITIEESYSEKYEGYCVDDGLELSPSIFYPIEQIVTNPEWEFKKLDIDKLRGQLKRCKIMQSNLNNSCKIALDIEGFNYNIDFISDIIDILASKYQNIKYYINNNLTKTIYFVDSDNISSFGVCCGMNLNDETNIIKIEI